MTRLGIAALVALATAASSASARPLASTPCATPAPTPIAPTPVVTDADLERLRASALVFPVPAVSPAAVRDAFGDRRGGRVHEALDIAAPRGAAVVAVDDGIVAKLFESVPGGHTIYLFDDERRFAYYYAHLDAYAPELAEGRRVRRGDVIGTVGTSGNAAPDSPHLHFAIFKLELEPRWWRGTPINPHLVLVPPGRF
jgi:peptidoglycan LD-endopeptidase LytH